MKLSRLDRGAGDELNEKAREISGAFKGNALRDFPPRQQVTLRRATLLALAVAVLSSCTAVTEPDFQSGVPSYNSSSSLASGQQVQGQVTAVTGVPVDDAEDALPAPGAPSESLPNQVGALPTEKPEAHDAAAPGQTQAGVTPDAQATGDGSQPAAPTGDQPAAGQIAAATDAGAVATETAQGETTAPAAATTPAAPPARKLAPPPSGDRGSSSIVAKRESVVRTPVNPATAGDGSVVSAAPAPAKSQGLLASFFGAGGNSGANKPRATGTRDNPGVVASKPAPKPAAKAEAEVPGREIDFSSLSTEEPPQRVASADALPGVRQSALFEIKRRSGLDDDADVDIYEEEDYGPIQTANAAGMVRSSPNGLLRQTESVDVACLKPSLVRVLKQVEQRFGKKMVVTSGYRSPSRNRRARGAKNSLHMYCAAVDIQIPGVGKTELARYVRSMPGRGGVGTYCHTDSIHVDVGPERDWSWRCRGKRRR